MAYTKTITRGLPDRWSLKPELLALVQEAGLVHDSYCWVNDHGAGLQTTTYVHHLLGGALDIETRVSTNLSGEVDLIRSLVRNSQMPDHLLYVDHHEMRGILMYQHPMLYHRVTDQQRLAAWEVIRQFNPYVGPMPAPRSVG